MGWFSTVALTAVALIAGGCDEGRRYEGQPRLICTPGEIECRDQVAGLCNEGGSGWVWSETCEGHTPHCEPGLGCVSCDPGEGRCQGNVALRCADDGSGWELVERCEGDSLCYEGHCDRDCARAALEHSYLGCDYWALTSMNSNLSTEFSPALVIGNGNEQPATVTVTRGTSFYRQIVVPPNATGTIEIPWISDLKDGSLLGLSTDLSGAAYHLESSLPVTVYQFDPLQYELEHDCRDTDAVPGDGACFSYSNDASLLLPTAALTRHYIVMSWQSLGLRYEIADIGLVHYTFAPSVLAIVNPQQEDVSVEVTLTAPVAPGRGVFGMPAGRTAYYTIPPGGVLQLATDLPSECEPDHSEDETTYCAGGRECTYGYCDLFLLDLTGSEVVASAPVAVFGAHDCAFVPYDRWACDHLEEQIFPFETLGRHFVVAPSHRENGEPDIIRVLSGADHNVLRFDPAVSPELSLDRGEHVDIEVWEPFELVTDGPALVGQYLVGQNYNFVPVEQDLPPGDPAFALAVPVEQWRGSYTFLAPDSFDRSFINIVAPKDGFHRIELDGTSLAEEAWQRVGRSDYVALRLEIEPGAHSIATLAEGSFGLLLYGFGQYTSYMLPGGLNLEPIAVW